MASKVCAASRCLMRRGYTLASRWQGTPSQVLQLRRPSDHRAVLSLGQKFSTRRSQGESREIRQKSDKELYDGYFEPFGVSKEQFRLLMGFGTRCKAPVGEVLVQG